MIRLIACCILLTLTVDVHATDSAWYLEPIQFILVHDVNRIGPVITLRPGASANELHGAMAESYNISFPFELQLSGEIIASSRLLTNHTLGEIPSIVSMAKDLSEICGPGFRIPLKIRRLVVSDSDFGVFTSLAQMIGGAGSNIHMFKWYQFILNCMESP